MKRNVRQELMKLALAVDEGVSEVRLETGEGAGLERDPSVPGSLKITSLTAAGDEEGWVLITVGSEAISVPTFYPPDIPFIPGTTALFNFLNGKLQLGTWTGAPEDGVETRMRTWAQGAADLAGSLNIEKIRHGDDGEPRTPVDMVAKAGEWVSGLGDAGRRTLGEVQDALQVPEEQNSRLELRLGEVVRGLQGGGWVVVEESEMTTPVSSHTVILDMDGRRRSVCRTGSILGGLIMIQESVSPDAAPGNPAPDEPPRL